MTMTMMTWRRTGGKGGDEVHHNKGMGPLLGFGADLKPFST